MKGSQLVIDPGSEKLIWPVLDVNHSARQVSAAGDYCYWYYTAPTGAAMRACAVWCWLLTAGRRSGWCRSTRAFKILP